MVYSDNNPQLMEKIIEYEKHLRPTYIIPTNEEAILELKLYYNISNKSYDSSIYSSLKTDMHNSS
jgi:hypothetical protein